MSADASAEWGNPYVVVVVARGGGGLGAGWVGDGFSEEMPPHPLHQHPHGHLLQLSSISLFRSIYQSSHFLEFLSCILKIQTGQTRESHFCPFLGLSLLHCSPHSRNASLFLPKVSSHNPISKFRGSYKEAAIHNRLHCFAILRLYLHSNITWREGP